MKKHKNRRLKTVIIIAVVLVILFGGFYSYTLNYYRADASVESLLAQSKNIQTLGNITVIYPQEQTDLHTGFIFYPGGKVEAAAYLPLLEKLSQEGVTCILLKMPLNLAVFDITAAERVYDRFPDIQSWYLGGHSLGGAMASSYVGSHGDNLSGLILLGAYPVNDAALPTLVIYGSEDVGLDLTKLEGTENILEIIGGNHAYFGNYGEQKGDGVAAITREDQHTQTIDAIMSFIGSN